MLDHKNGLKMIMIEFPSSLKLNEIHIIDSPFNKDPKNIFFQEALILGEERPENVRKMGNNRDIYCYANWGVDNFKREYQPLPGAKILVMSQFDLVGQYKKNVCQMFADSIS